MNFQWADECGSCGIEFGWQQTTMVVIKCKSACFSPSCLQKIIISWGIWQDRGFLRLTAAPNLSNFVENNFASENQTIIEVLGENSLCLRNLLECLECALFTRVNKAQNLHNECKFVCKLVCLRALMRGSVRLCHQSVHCACIGGRYNKRCCAPLS